ncbi:MAG TPA: alpha/beta hydrolase [Polyangiaceae bacterium]|jgi:pimeloyl-ACP methyl ester carboxylesterase|nr:alpha/beta hydrolase [Polyangiaceae bacterium]
MLKSTPKQADHRTINGVNYYYEVHGEGEPLLLLHGGLGSIDMFGPKLAELAQGRRVIAVDLQGHGRTPLGDRAFRLESMGDDMAALVRHLGHEQADVMGYSLGGGVALRMALQSPKSVRRLVLVSTPFSDSGFYPGIRGQQKQISAQMLPMMKETPMYKSYAAVAPNVDDFARLLDVLGAYMKQSYDWSAEIPTLPMPTMLVYGDGDMFLPEHEIAFYKLLGGGKQDAGWMRETLSQNRLAILPDVTHYDIFTAPSLTPTVLPFLNGTSAVKSWAEQVSATQASV